jgi:hypothetical protein
MKTKGYGENSITFFVFPVLSPQPPVFFFHIHPKTPSNKKQADNQTLSIILATLWKTPFTTKNVKNLSFSLDILTKGIMFSYIFVSHNNMLTYKNIIFRKRGLSQDE